VPGRSGHRLPIRHASSCRPGRLIHENLEHELIAEEALLAAIRRQGSDRVWGQGV